MMRSLEILCLVLVGLAVVQAQGEEPAAGTRESSELEPSTTSVYDRFVKRIEKLRDHGNARLKGIANKITEASAKVQERISELNTQRAATGEEIMQEARSGASNLYDGVSEAVSQIGASMQSVLTTTAVKAFRLGHEITQVGQPTDPTQEVIDLLEDE